MDCVGSFSLWNGCSQTCGGGTQAEVYTITTMASAGGVSCNYSNGTTLSVACNTDPCRMSPTLTQFFYLFSLALRLYCSSPTIVSPGPTESRFVGRDGDVCVIGPCRKGIVAAVDLRIVCFAILFQRCRVTGIISP